MWFPTSIVFCPVKKHANANINVARIRVYKDVIKFRDYEKFEVL